MPNWCSNKMVIRGGKEDIQAVLDFISPDPSKDEFDFEKVIPVPPALTEVESNNNAYPMEYFESLRRALCGYPSCYEFCVSEWGTKWIPDDVTIDRPSGVVYFSTAWCPPLGIFLELSRKFPSVVLFTRSFEGGCGICQEESYSNGSTVFTNYPQYHSKEWYEIMFDAEGGEDLYHYDSELGTYVENDD